MTFFYDKLTLAPTTEPSEHWGPLGKVGCWTQLEVTQIINVVIGSGLWMGCLGLLFCLFLPTLKGEILGMEVAPEVRESSASLSIERSFGQEDSWPQHFFGLTGCFVVLLQCFFDHLQEGQGCCNTDLTE